ncbi:MAG: hypothetical protein Q8R02_14045 [Hyphomonadaceae bacterium]|nr:hypothetical protein [Hyphomonadaceae bacterium]
MTVTPNQLPNALSPTTLAEVERIRTSGVLGATGRLVELFDYLVTRSAEDRPPKEAEIALAVFGKSDSDSMRDDPVARVYIHRLRKRLDDFYLRNGTPSGARLDIPKGDYRIVSTDPAAVAETPAIVEALKTGPTVLAAAPKARKVRWGMMAAAFAAVLVAGNIGAWAVLSQPAADKTVDITETGVWSEIANSERPLLIVVGDYYVFGEYEEQLSLKRLIRDFSINSKEDLVQHYRNDPQGFDQYSDVAMQYLPPSAAYALADLAPIMRSRADVQVVLASELSPDRLKTDDIIYVGLLSGMGPLRNPVFAQSRFTFGESFDQIVDRDSGKKYTSEAFLAAPQDTMYRDYGFFSTFKGPGGNRISILSGSRDTAVMGVAENLTKVSSLAELEKKMPAGGDFEALFEVKGQKHVNLETRMLAAYQLSSPDIWRGADANPVKFPTE